MNILHHHIASLGAQTLARVPIKTAMPPSFNGDPFLYAFNLFIFSAGFAALLMFCIKLLVDQYKCSRAHVDSEDYDAPKSPMKILRWIGILWTGAHALRCGSAAQALWRWNPYDPVSSAAAVALQRVIDPIAANIGYGAVALFFLALPGLTRQCRKEPFPVDMWRAIPDMKRPAAVIALCLIAAVGVVATR